MAILCPTCGRGYDVTLFRFGRTIHCTCGTRVGREPQERSVRRGGRPRFVCDAMLGRLARWLRALGYDCVFDPAIDDADLVTRAVEERRAILTRDRRLAEEWRVSECLVLEAEDPLERLRRVCEAYGIDRPHRLFSRCLECNRPLEEAGREAVIREVPPAVRRRRREFRRCPDCGKVFWEGSHTRRMRREIETVLPGRGSSFGED